MATVRKLPSGNYRVQGCFTDPITGKQTRPSFTAPTRTEAMRLWSEWEENKTCNTFPRDMTVKECINSYIELKTAVLSPATIRGYRGMQRCMYSMIDNFSLKSITNADLQYFISVISKTHSPKTVKNAWGLLQASLSMFSERHFDVTLPQKKPVERNIPIDSHIKVMMDLANDDMKLAIALAAVGTLRRGEIPALHYRDILHDSDSIYIHGDVVQQADNSFIYKDIPKTSSSVRIVPLPHKVIEMMGDGAPDEFIFKHTPNYITSRFGEIRDKAGLKCRFHDLRHYAASIMHALGVPDQYIMERGGWKSDAVLKSIYRNSLSDQSAKFAQVANDHFSELF